MSTKLFIAVVAGLLFLIGVGGYVFVANNTQTKQGMPSASSSKSRTISTSEVSSHNSSDDCWTIVRGNVYDITSYISRHPGGDEIVRACGEDSTTLFESRMTTSGETVGSGQPHSKAARQQLERLKIGSLE